MSLIRQCLNVIVVAEKFEAFHYIPDEILLIQGENWREMGMSRTFIEFLDR